MSPLLLLLLAAPAGAVPPDLDLDSLTKPVADPAGVLLKEGIERGRKGDHAGAAAVLAAAAVDLGALSDYARTHGAEAAMALGQAGLAVSLLDGLAGGTPLDDGAVGLRGRALAAAGRQADALVPLRSYLDRFPGGRQAPEVHAALADALASLGRTAEAAAERRRLWARYPRRLPDVPAPADPTPDEVLDRAARLYDSHRHAEVLALVEPLRKRKDLDEVRGCRAAFLAGSTRSKMRKHADAASDLGGYVKDGCAAERVRALYLLGRSRSRSGDNPGAISAYELLSGEFPKSSYADDALLLKAETWIDEKRPDRALAVLREQVRRYPDGDMAEEARWRLAWLPYQQGKPKAALAALDQALRSGRREGHYYSRGRTLYWKGRVSRQLGRTSDACAAWRSAIRDYPLSYYALQAANRLREAGRPAGPDLLPPPSGPTTWRFPHRAAFDGPGFARGVRLLRLGLPDLAYREFDALGLLAGADPEAAWLAAVLFERVGQYDRSHNVPRRRVASYQDRPPTGDALREWLVAYPRPFAPEVQAAASEGKVPSDLLLALVREESGFNPDIESWANAIGLAQLLLGTARGVAKGLSGVTVDAQTLRDPALNLRLGARFLGGLLARFGHEALAVAGYNAGGGAVGRWRKRFSGLAADELVESVPYEQTRNYTKRVLMAWGRYRYLYGAGDVVSLPLPIP